VSGLRISDYRFVSVNTPQTLKVGAVWRFACVTWESHSTEIPLFRLQAERWLERISGNLALAEFLSKCHKS
jgi:hypothetical protein